MDFVSIREQVMELVGPKRRAHVEGCVAEAERLAVRWGADTENARTAALLHDVTKAQNRAGQLQLCGQYGIIPNRIELKEYKILHAATGAALARERFGANEEVCSAIRWHTTGRAGMSLLEKILFLADFIEPTRDFEGVDEVRSLAYGDLDGAIIRGIGLTLDEILGRRGLISPETVEAYNCLLFERDG